MDTFWWIVTLLGYLVTLLLIRWALLLKKRQPGSTIAWIFVIILVPFVGGLFFLIFGINSVQRRAALKQAAHDRLSRQLPVIPAGIGNTETFSTDKYQHLITLVGRVAGTEPTFGNTVEISADTNRTLGLIEQAIGAAERTLHLEYYIWQPDQTGSRIRDLLIDKARSGVKVRFLYDGLGSMRLTRRFIKPMRDAGIEVAPFLPGLSWRQRWSINLRSHRKIVIVDGRVGFTGGMNIGDEYLGKDRRLGYWRDTHLRLVGPAVSQLQQVFAEDWFFATGRSLTDPELFPKQDTTGSVVGQIAAGEPAVHTRALFSLMFAAINEARESVTLVTSYFVPPPALVEALECAALRGVRVRILVPGRSAHQWTVWAGRSYYEKLMRVGVEIYEYHTGLLHSKTLTIDGQWSFVGTPNFDARSLLLNFEVGMVLYDDNIAQELEQQFKKDLRNANRIDLTPWLLRPERHVLLECFFRLFAPVL